MNMLILENFTAEISKSSFMILSLAQFTDCREFLCFLKLFYVFLFALFLIIIHSCDVKV